MNKTVRSADGYSVPNFGKNAFINIYLEFLAT